MKAAQPQRGVRTDLPRQRSKAPSFFSTVGCLGALTLATVMHGPLWAQDASALSGRLTPVGAERAGNKDGSIPAWVAEKQDSGWSWGKPRLSAWKYKDDKPLFSVDASNVDKYADKLSPGQIATIKQVKGYRMDVYPTRRTCNVPDFVAENTRKNVGFAKLAANGWALQDAWVPGVLFPMPSNGTEAMWNMAMRYRGVATEFKGGTTLVSPRQGSNEWIRYVYDQTVFLPWAEKGSRKLSETGKNRSHTAFSYISPTALSGQAGVISDFFDQAGTEAFYYFPGQRRVRRLPSYAYDAPQVGFENQYAIDEVQVFQGALDRFDWKLAGKKELLVPYNAFGAFEFDGKMTDIAQPNFINPKNRRYELHRVWVIEATVKAGVRHLAPKRTFYLDEDSWNAVLAEDYDAQGKLWKVREGFLIPVFETGSCDVVAFSQQNLVDNRYLFDFHAAGTGTDVRWFTEPSGPKMKPSYYTSENLRAVSER
jgi:hypothetical protein